MHYPPLNGWNRLRKRLGMSLIFPLLLSPVLSACGDDSSSSTRSVVGLWNATSFISQSMDLIADGMSLVVALDDQRVYAFSFANDKIGACDPGPNCIETGTYATADGIITIDPGSDDEMVFSYEVSSSTMTWAGDLDGNPVTITFSRS